MAEQPYKLSKRAQSRLKREGYSRETYSTPARPDYMESIRQKGEVVGEARSKKDYGRGGMSHLAATIYQDRYGRRPGPRKKARASSR